jgi:sugar transferase (PEP-CTERM/EpsH1 system associated)
MMKIMFLAHRIPYPPNRGDKIRSWHLLKHLAKRFEIYLGCFVDEKNDWRYVAELQQLCAEVFAVPLYPKWRKLTSLRSLMSNQPMSQTYYTNRRMSVWVERIIAAHHPQIELAFSGYMASYLTGASPNVLKIIDFVDVISAKSEKYATTASSPLLRGIYKREASKLVETERRLVEDANYSLFVSDAEASIMRSRGGPAIDRIHAVENGVDIAYFDPAIPHECPLADALHGSRLVFIGHMQYWPNIDAMLWFAQSIFPKVLNARSDAKLCIVGAHPPQAITRLDAQPGIVVAGSVPDIRPWLASADVVLAPMRIACGVQNKILEAMAMQKAVVCTSPGLMGIDAKDGQHLVVADDAESTVSAILQLLDDETRRNTLGLAARQKVIDYYGWERRLEAIDDLIDKHFKEKDL